MDGQNLMGFSSHWLDLTPHASNSSLGFAAVPDDGTNRGRTEKERASERARDRDQGERRRARVGNSSASKGVLWGRFLLDLRAAELVSGPWW